MSMARTFTIVVHEPTHNPPAPTPAMAILGWLTAPLDFDVTFVGAPSLETFTFTSTLPDAPGAPSPGLKLLNRLVASSARFAAASSTAAGRS